MGYGYLFDDFHEMMICSIEMGAQDHNKSLCKILDLLMDFIMDEVNSFSKEICVFINGANLFLVLENSNY